MNTPKEKEESLHLSDKKYKKLISELQFQVTPYGLLHLYQGFWYYQRILEKVMSLQDNYFCAKPTDVLLGSSMKSGTTWLKALAFAIVTRTKFDISSSPLLNTMPHKCVPFLEIGNVANSSMQIDPELPLLATHIPYTSLPRSIIASCCKIVYIYRDPKDVLVSMWHFVCTFIPEGMATPSFDVFFELFLKGLCCFGSFWDHVLSYRKASLERPGTILLLKYEDLMIDTELYVKKIAEFMGCAFSAEEEKEGVVEKMVKLCSFENLSNLNINKTGKYRIDGSTVVNSNIFFRKGQSGDWKNYLTTEMAEMIDKITEEKFVSCGLMVPSKSHH